MLNQQIVAIIKRCKRDPVFFIEKFCKTQHPSKELIPFILYDYQKKAIDVYLRERMILWRKTRQCGASAITGAYMLWYAMFHNHKNVLLVSKSERDATDFLDRIKLMYQNLPDWMRKLWGKKLKPHAPVDSNAHTIKFANQSRIRSLNSNKDVLRSNPASLVIIDEAAFIEKAEEMWKAGYPTLTHGDRVIVISTPKGLGNWYWSVYTDAEAGANQFKLITVHWYDMNWVEEKKEIDGSIRVVSPIKDIRKTTTKEERDKFGEFWSPWLQEQYGALVNKGNEQGFRQEILAEFIGSGHTVLSRDMLDKIRVNLDPNYIVPAPIEYNHPSLGYTLVDFGKDLWIWSEPVMGNIDKIEGQRRRAAVDSLYLSPKKQTAEVLTPEYPHQYVIGVDAGGGEGGSNSTIMILDATTKEQVAEYCGQIRPNELAVMVDCLARYYNGAFVVAERSGPGLTLVQALEYDLMYENLYVSARTPGNKKRVQGSMIGYPMSERAKVIMNQDIRDFIANDLKVKSTRLWKEANIYVHLGGQRTGHEPGPGNYDDLMISLGLACTGIKDLRHSGKLESTDGGGLSKSIEMPLYSTDGLISSPGEELDNFIRQLGGVPPSEQPPVKITDNKGPRVIDVGTYTHINRDIKIRSDSSSPIKKH